MYKKHSPIENQNCKNNLIQNITIKSTVILGVSGGPDSMYLLHKCLAIQKDHPFSIIIAHVDHGLRKESAADANFVKKIAQKNNLPFENIQLNLLSKKGNQEELGREARYAFFENLRKKHKAEWVITAHHLNDNIETSLFNLIRGSSISGIRGMSIISSSKHLFRPMLSITKEEIESYLKRNKITYRIDKTNNNLSYSRNFLRKKIIPLLHNINPAFEQTFAFNLETFQDISFFIEEKSQAWLKRNGMKKFFLHEFLKEPIFMQKNILASLYKKIYGNSRKLSHKQLNEILKTLHLKKSNRKKEFGSSYFVLIKKNNQDLRQVWIEKKSSFQNSKISKKHK